MYVSEVWIHINAYANKLERAEDEKKFSFYMTRFICHTVHLHSMADKKEKNPERFMPSPWGERGEPVKIARTNQEVWDDYEKRKQAKANKDG